MAINYLNSIDLNQNELIHGTIENQPNDTAAGTPVSGQLYYNTTNKVLKYGKDDGTGTIVWSEIDTDTGITSIELASDGDATSGNTITANGTLTLSFDGQSSDYVNGAGDLVAFPTIPAAYSFNVSDGSNSGAVASGDTVTLSGTGTTTVTYASGSNTFTINSADQYEGTVESVGLSMPAAFNVADSPVTGSGTLTVTGAGATTEYIDGTGALQTFPTTDNYNYWVLSDGTTTTNITSTNTATFQGTDDEVEVAEASGTITIGLPDDVTIGGNLTVTTALDMTDGQINNLANGTASTDAVNLGQVQGLIAGTGQFQGGYDATNDPGSPVISGSSNIALNTGDFYVVTVDGDITFSDQTISVEVGDLIFANTDITANSNPASTVYTFVIQDQNIAGEGANDAATEKGVAGFNSAHFSVTSNGFVSADIYGGGSTLGIVPSGGVATTFLRGDGTWAAPSSANTYAATITDSVSGTTFEHGLGDDVIVQLYDVTTKETVYADVERNGNYLNITFASTPTNSIRVLVQKIG